MQNRNNSKGFSLAEIMIVVGIIALLAAIAIPNLIRAKTSANEASAQAKLKSISTAFENYATTNNQYPSSTTLLFAVTPPYLNTDYFTGVHNGYSFTSTLNAYDYSVTAIPINNVQGTKSFTINTGGIFIQN